MEIKIESGRITIIGATREELKAFSEFVYGGIPYEVAVPEKEIVAEIKSDTNVSVDKKETTTVSKLRSNRSRCPVVDGYLSVREFAKKYDRSTSTVNFHIKRGLPTKEFDGHILVNEVKGKAYLDAHHDANKQSGMKKRHAANNFDEAIKSYDTWLAYIDNRIKGAGLKLGVTKKSLIDKMRTKYGVCWAQEKQDFYRQKGRLPKTDMELCYYVQYEKQSKDAYYKMAEGILTTIEEVGA